MTSVFNSNLANGMDEPGKRSAIMQLVELGRQKSFVTIGDILEFLPEAEKDSDRLEEAFAALLNAGIAYTEDTQADEPSEEELVIVEDELSPDPGADESYLANIEIGDSIALYLREVGRIPLLTRNEEVELAQRIEHGRLAREEFARGHISPRRRLELRALIEDSGAAREQLITANSRLVVSVAKKYQGRGVPFLDLIQEGNIGLIRAVKKFDFRRGFKFSTYATWWIRQAVTRALSDQGRTIRVPVHMGDQINKLKRAQYQLSQRLGHDPSMKELAEALGTSPQKVEELFEIARWPLSLETPMNNEDDAVLGDYIQDKEMPAPEESATENLLREHLDAVLSGLPPREVRILQLRYGLLDGQSYTLEEVGRKMGVTRERVRQIEAHALSRLRQPSIRSRLRDYLR